jgi:hypothetical protein
VRCLHAPAGRWLATHTAPAAAAPAMVPAPALVRAQPCIWGPAHAAAHPLQVAAFLCPPARYTPRQTPRACLPVKHTQPKCSPSPATSCSSPHARHRGPASITPPKLKQNRPQVGLHIAAAQQPVHLPLGHPAVPFVHSAVAPGHGQATVDCQRLPALPRSLVSGYLRLRWLPAAPPSASMSLARSLI